MKLADWARQQGIAYITAWRWWKRGKLPVPAWQTETGTILVDAPARLETGAAADTPQHVALYARVSSSDQTGDLDRHIADVGFHEFRRQLAYKAERAGVRVKRPQ